MNKSWPFEEARRLVQALSNTPDQRDYILFETGYGASGLPHIGTFGEVVRTSMVRYAFSKISDLKTRLFTFSDDMDALRKVPENVPNQAMLKEYLGKPLTSIPDPYEKFESFGHHNNAKLRSFLDSFSFSYEFQSSTEWYKGGHFDEALIKVLQNYKKIMSIILPTLREERQKTYSPFLPICPETGVVLQVPMEEIFPDRGTIVYKDPKKGRLTEIPVTGGYCKLQWKVDWGMRWYALGVNYEMSGKDLIDSVKLSSQVCRVLGGKAPEGIIYEHFLDEKGQKISKSKGNGLTVDEWLRYAPRESLSYYMYQSPKKAKRLYFDVIPRATDDYLKHTEAYQSQIEAEKTDNPCYHIHEGKVPSPESGLSFSILLNLASVCNAEEAAVLWGFVQKYIPDAAPSQKPFLNRLIHHALDYYKDFIKPYKIYREPTEQEKNALLDLLAFLSNAPGTIDADLIQQEIFQIGHKHHFTNLRDWFSALYEVLLGQKEGPRMGSFISLYGIHNMKALIEEKLGLV